MTDNLYNQNNSSDNGSNNQTPEGEVSFDNLFKKYAEGGLNTTASQGYNQNPVQKVENSDVSYGAIGVSLNKINNPEKSFENSDKKSSYDELSSMTTGITTDPESSSKISNVTNNLNEGAPMPVNAITPQNNDNVDLSFAKAGINHQSNSTPNDKTKITSKDKQPTAFWKFALTGVISALLAVALVIGAANLGLIHFTESISSLNTLNTLQDEKKQAALSGDSVAPEWEKVFASVSNSVVSIQVSDGKNGDLGSGFIFDTTGHIITNNHVISIANGNSGMQIQVTLANGQLYEAKITGVDKTSDLAVIELQNPPANLEPVKFTDSSKLVVGDNVMAVGNPLGLDNTATTGIISALDRPVTASTQEEGSGNPFQTQSQPQDITVTNALQLDASINPGNSGGPLFNAVGEVVGVTSSIATTSSSSGSIGLGFAIPSNLTKRIADEIVKNGKSTHVSLGVSIVDGQVKVDDVTRKAAEIKAINDGSPASKAGLKVGDYIVSVDKKVVSSTYSLMGYIRELALGSTVKIGYVRDSKVYQADVVLDQEQKETTQTAPSTDDSQKDDDQGDGSLWDPWGLFGDDSK